MTNSMNDALHLRQIGQQRIATTIGLVNLTYNLFRFDDKVKNSIMSLLNVCFNTKIQRNYLWNQQKTLSLNIEIFKTKSL